MNGDTKSPKCTLSLLQHIKFICTWTYDKLKLTTNWTYKLKSCIIQNPNPCRCKIGTN